MQIRYGMNQEVVRNAYEYFEHNDNVNMFLMTLSHLLWNIISYGAPCEKNFITAKNYHMRLKEIYTGRKNLYLTMIETCNITI